MDFRKAQITVLLLRLLALLFLAGSIFTFTRNNIKNVKGSLYANNFAYKYVLATGVMAFLYTAVQVPCAAFHLCTGKRLIRKEWFLNFEFYGDKMSSFLLASGVGAGFVATYEFKEILNRSSSGGDDVAKAVISAIDKFLDRGYLGTAVLLLGFICMATLSVFSSANRSVSNESNKDVNPFGS